MIPSKFQTLIRFPRLLPAFSFQQTRSKFLNNGQIPGEDDDVDLESLPDRVFEDLSLELYKEIYEDDKSDKTKHRIEFILQEYEFLKYNTIGKVPTNISVDEMNRIINETHATCDVRMMINYLFKREVAKVKSKYKKQVEQNVKSIGFQSRLDNIQEADETKTGLFGNSSNNLLYGLWHNSLFTRITSSAINERKRGNLVSASLYGPKVIFDFSFLNSMNFRAKRSMAEQLQESYGLNVNRYNGVFDLWFANYDFKSDYAPIVERSLKNLTTTSMITIKEDCFTNHFDKSRLVYLSPDAEESLSKHVGSNNDVYIIGALVDLSHKKPFTLRKAQELGIRSRKLPIERYVAWKFGTKSLCLNQVLGILLESYKSEDWSKAFEMHLPGRKVKSIDEILKEEKYRQDKFKKYHDNVCNQPRMEKFDFSKEFFQS